MFDLLPDTRDMLEDIFDAFHRIESKDLRVDQITIPRPQYYKLKADPTIGHYMDWGQPITTLNDGGKLFGADVVLGDKFEVKALGFVPRWWSEEMIAAAYADNSEIAVCEPVVLGGLTAKKRYLRRRRRGFTIISSRANPVRAITPPEMRALDTLREMVTEEQFKYYLKNGFLLVTGASGAVYQIPRMGSHTKVWKNGKLIKEVCVRVAYDQNVPPTDNVIAFKTMIETSEEDFLKCGNIFNMHGMREAA